MSDNATKEVQYQAIELICKCAESGNGKNADIVRKGLVEDCCGESVRGM